MEFQAKMVFQASEEEGLPITFQFPTHRLGFHRDQLLTLPLLQGLILTDLSILSVLILI